MTWDPEQYLRYESERALPFRHLVAAIDHHDPSIVIDLGCGPGGLTATLLECWPAAHIIGVDASEEMIGHARRRTIARRLAFELGDMVTWRAPKPVDLMLANASFHWIDDHSRLFDHLLPQLADGGVLAFQVPANHAEPSHTSLAELCSSSRWRQWLEGLPTTGVREPQWYINELESRDLEVVAWQTTFFHVLEGHDPVLEWVRGTTLRPILERLPENSRESFLDEYGEQLREAYPARNGKTVFAFRRTFVVSTKTQKTSKSSGSQPLLFKTGRQT